MVVSVVPIPVVWHRSWEMSVMDVAIEVRGQRSGDELRSLCEWLVADERLRGRVRLDIAPPVPGTLGSALETLSVAVGPGGVATALASVLITWIRRRTGSVSLKVSKPDGSTYELNAAPVRGLTATEVRELAGELAQRLAPEPEGTQADGS
ncbi:effector-associated constant component EACC1 [Streptomyces orinoci]|uniref:Uncharacterized protein n=1 Tax=Streptomyces orinoci TaxID=67339 RepID=A0ABV3JUV6_STRON|nr:hypothetical protein [Streptomyces orinoci]